MAFNVKYHNQAENELKQRRETNIKETEARRRKLEEQFPEFVRLRAAMASTWAQIAAVMLGSGDSDSKETQETKLAQIQAENTKAAVKMKELLMRANYPPDYLDPIYSCKLCQDTGVTQFSRCDCYTSTVKRLAAAGINSTSPLTLTGFETFEIEMYPDVVYEKANINIRTIMRNHFDYCKNYAENFHMPNPGLLLIGQTGLGKTHLSLAIAGKVLSKGFNAVYGSAPDLFRKIESEHFQYYKNTENGGNTMDALQSAELLILDDIGAEFESKFYNSAFYNLLNSRMNAGNPTIISTNFTMEELKERYGDRIASRLLTMKILKFHGNDIRLIKRKAPQ
jgi:DNA replication protein DnaC